MEVPRLNRLMKSEDGAITQGIVGDINPGSETMKLRGRPGEYYKGVDGLWHLVEPIALPLLQKVSDLERIND